MILHLDMDAFFAAVEQLDNPAWVGQPVIVGGGVRGVVSTASYEARKYGIHSAMPAVMARKLCPHGIFLPGRYERYVQLSREIMASLRKFAACVQPASIDEAYLKLPPETDVFQQAMAVKELVKKVSGGLTCSVGVAPVKFLAKICSDYHKPDGIFILEPEEMDDFLKNLHVKKIPGVGARMAESLLSFGISSVAQLRGLSREFMERKYGKFGLMLHDRAFGIDGRDVHENPPPKSEGRERTFERNIIDRAELAKYLEEQAEKISSRLKRQGLKGRAVTLKIKFENFHQITRSRTMEYRMDAASEIFQVALALLNETPLPLHVRLMGICVSGFEPRPEQLPLPGLPRLWPKKSSSIHNGDK